MVEAFFKYLDQSRTPPASHDFGFPIHGCIDSFSQKILWLFVSRTNIDPGVTTAFCLDCVREQGGSPLILIIDPGSENPVMVTMQSMLRSNGIDEYSGENLHRLLESNRNQRIKAWWSFYGRNRQLVGTTFLKIWLIEVFGVFWPVSACRKKVCSFWSCAFLAICSSERMCAWQSTFSILSLVSIKPITTTTTTNFESKQSD